MRAAACKLLSAAVLLSGLACAEPDRTTTVRDEMRRADSPRSHSRKAAPTSQPAGAPLQEPAAELAYGVTASAPADATHATLELAPLLESVDRNFPLLLAVEQDREIAAGKVLSAEGGFDLTARGEFVSNPQGYYRNERVDTLFEQPTPFWGTTLFSGYRWGRGDYPSYYENYLTDRGGEVRAGVKVPLLQGGPIDQRRVNLLKAQIERQLAEPQIQGKRIEILRKAAGIYWKWVAFGQKLQVARAVLRIAQERDDAIRRRVERGDIPRIDLVNNEQLIAQREAAVLEAERFLNNSAIELSLFWRDAEGQTRPVTPEALPAAFPLPSRPDSGRLQADIDAALRRRPDLRKIVLLKEQVALDLRLAENKLLPKLDFVITGSQDQDLQTYKGDKSEFELEAKVLFEMPLWLREARGKIRELRGKLSKLTADQHFARDRVQADVRYAMNNLVLTYARLAELQQNVRKAREVEEGERRLFNLGNSTILNVQVREQTTFDAAKLEVDATEEFFQATADYRAATAQDADEFNEMTGSSDGSK